MKIGVVGPQGPDDFADNVLNALPRIGLDPVPLGPALTRPPGAPLARLHDLAVHAAPGVARAQQKSLVKRARDAEVDLVLTVDAAMHPQTVASLRRNGVKTVLWYPDAVVNFGRQLLLLAPYERIYVKEPVVVPRLRDLLGLPVDYLPEACNPSWHTPLGRPQVMRTVIVAGNMYPSRVLLLNRLAADGVPLALYGGRVSTWIGPQPALEHHTHRYLARDAKARVFREATAVLNNLHPGEFEGVNCRLFEAAGCGAAVLAEWRPTLDSLFDVDHELFAFRSYGELLEQIERIFGDPDEATARGDRASARAHREHSYDVRLRQLFEDVLE